jgi:hypothetical protein
MRKGYGKGYRFFAWMMARRSDTLSLQLLDDGIAPLISRHFSKRQAKAIN